MKLLRYILCASCILAASNSGIAAEKNKAAKQKTFSLAKLQQAYKGASSLEADFTQEFYQAALAKTKTSTGNLKLARTNLVRWEIYEPEASVMVSDGRKVNYFTPNARGKGKGQVIVSKAKELTKQPLFRILTGASALDQEFKIESQTAATAPEKDAVTGTELKLAPKKPMGDLESVVLRVSPKYLIEELILTTQGGNKTKITLQNQSLGAKLPSQLFEFKPPADTEVITN